MKTSVSATLLCFLIVLALLSSSVDAKDDAKKFQAAIEATSGDCRLACVSCFERSVKAQELYAHGKFCAMMTLVEGTTSTKACLTKKGGCTKQEYDKLKDAACGATSLVVSLAAVVIGVVASTFGK